MTPLKLEEIQFIEATKLPAIDRHYLRLLAHCLACFKSMNGSAAKGSLPNEKVRMDWCLNQPTLKNEKTFIPVLLEQLDSAGHQLEAMASELKISPLELSLQNLVEAYSSKIDDNLSSLQDKAAHDLAPPREGVE